MSNSHRLIVIVKRRPFDAATWKRLVLAYAYAIYEQRRAERPASSEVASQ